MYWRPSPSMVPHSAVGGCTQGRESRDLPLPNGPAKVSVACTIIGAMAFGSTWRTRMTLGRWPRARAASTNTYSRMERTEPRTRRMNDGMALTQRQ